MTIYPKTNRREISAITTALLTRICKVSLPILLVVIVTFGVHGLAQDQSPPIPNKADQAKLKKALSGKRSELLKVAGEVLSPLEYKVSFKSGTERSFRNRYWSNKEAGLYVDLISGEPLFSSAHKFKSGTGWPSFDRPLGESQVVEVVDQTNGMKRVEVRSKASDIHLGHVFEDGPKKTTGRRFCINSASLRFVPLSEIKAEGYEDVLEEAELMSAYKSQTSSTEQSSTKKRNKKHK